MTRVTQTYLSRIGDSGLYVYYLFEDYREEHQRLTHNLQNALDDLGADYMKEVDIFRPNDRFAGRIAEELRNIPALWHYTYDRLPGFLACYKPMPDIDPNNDTVIFYSIRDKTEDDALLVIEKLRSLVREKVIRNVEELVPEEGEKKEGPGYLIRFWKALEIKPGWAGVAIELKRPERPLFG